MNWTFGKVLTLFIFTMFSVGLILFIVDTLNRIQIEMEANSAILDAPPAGYITPEIQQRIRDELYKSRGINGSNITITGTITVAQRKLKGDSDEVIELVIEYPRRIFVPFEAFIDRPMVVRRTISTEYVPQ